MNKNLIRAKQIVKSIAKSKQEIADGKVKLYSLDEVLDMLKSKKKTRLLKYIK